MKNLVRHVTATAALTLAASGAIAATPQLNRILPRGGQQGTEIDLAFEGQRLKDAQEVILYDKGLTVTQVEADKPDHVKVHVKIDKLAPIGEHRMRLRCASGISELRTFWVGPFPATQPAINSAKGGNKQPTNVSPETAMAVDKNVTVEGTVQQEQVQYFRVDAKKGDRISVEVEGIRLGSGSGNGGQLFDPYLAITDLKKFELATCDDTPLLKQDPFISMLAPKDGPFIIELRDTSFGGSPADHYRMHVGNFPRPKVIYPLGGQTGQVLKAQFLGDPTGPIATDVTLPKDPDEKLRVFANQNGVTAPSPNYLRASPFPNVMQDGADNHDLAKAVQAPVEPPLAFNGILAQPAGEDFYKFHAHKGQPLEIHVWARRLGSPLDSVITVYGAKGQYLANNDDAGNPDSYLRLTPPEDGDYAVAIRDHLKATGPDYVYRIEITQPKPEVVLSIPNASQVNGPSQERQTIPVPRGNRYATLIRATRKDVNGEFTLACPQLPDGITMTAAPMVANAAEGTPVIFEAKAEAPIAGKLCDFTVAPAAPATADAKDKPADAKDKPAEPLNAHVTQQVDLVIGQPNNTPYSNTVVNKLAVAVTDKAPFELTLVQPKAPLLQNGSLKLKVQAKRDDGFKKPIQLRFLFSPPGVSAQPVDLPADKNEIEMPISANEGAPTKKWQVCVIGSSDVDGAIWVASQFVNLEIAPPYFTGKVQMAAADQGGTTQVVCQLTQTEKFEGKAKVQLLGLPPNATAEPKEVSAADDKVVFDVVTGAKTPVGQHTSLFLQATIVKDGDEMTAATAKGGVFRVDPAKKVAAAPTTKPAEKGAVAKVQSPLDKLREEAAATKKD